MLRLGMLQCCVLLAFLQLVNQNTFEDHSFFRRGAEGGMVYCICYSCNCPSATHETLLHTLPSFTGQVCTHHLHSFCPCYAAS